MTRWRAWEFACACLCVAALGTAALAGGTAPCEGSGPTDRVAAWRAQVSTDPLHRYAVQTFGSPTGCHASLESAPEGPRFGALVLAFGGGARYEVDSSPPEATRISLRADHGLPDPARARAALAEQAATIGLEIDWEHPTREPGVERYHDPTPGLNASAELRTEGGKLVEVILRMAL